MLNGKRITFAITAMLALLLIFSGCYSVVAEELYRLPQASDRYLKLQKRIDEILATGAEYSPPTGGEQRQSVHLTDINGDGVNEAVAFFIARTEDNPLKIYIFSTDGDEYEVADIIEGIGTGIESVRYIDMDGDGTLEIAVGWQISSALRSAALYSLRDYQNIKLAQVDYTSLVIADVTGDGLPDLCAARIGTAESPSALEVISLMTDGEVISGVAHMSEGVESVSRFISGRLSDGVPAVFIDMKVPGGMITDVFCNVEGVLRNIARRSDEEQLPRIREDSSTDINGDGIIEVPFLSALPQQTEMTVYYSIDWCTYSSNGTRRVAVSTYHNYSDEWQLTIPQTWAGKFSVRREDNVRGERTVAFSFIDNGDVYDFLRIYKLTGDNRFERARLSGRFVLLEEGETIYAAALYDLDPGFPKIPGSEEIIKGFNLIYSDWLTGS